MNRNQEESPSDQTSSFEGDRLRLVISYASEDVEIASAIAKNLESALPARTIDVWFDKNIKLGETWKKELNNKLDNADILVTISTGKKKASHSFTGFEVGYFIASMNHRPIMSKKYNKAERFVIPIAIYTGIPETMDDFQGLEIPTIQVLNIDQASLQNKDNIDYQDKKNPFYLLFSQVASIIKSAEKLEHKEIEPLEKDILEYSKKLHVDIINELRKRISNERFRERKIIVRVKPPMTGSNDIVPLNNATIELIGPSFEILGFNTQFVGSISYNTLIDKITNKRYRTAWEDSIKSLVSSAKNGEFRDNSRTITSGGQRFQLFVSKCVQINSGEDEIHIYVVEIRGQNHGDKHTAMLLKAVSIGLNFRFMFLEKTSKFSPNTFNLALGENLKDKVYNLIQELQWLIWMSKDSGLYEADNLNLIYEDSPEDGEIDRQNNLWEEQEKKLWDAANEMLDAPRGSEVEIKKKFIPILREFCENTREMNRDFTSRSLEALQKIFSASNEHRKLIGSGVMCDDPRIAVGPDVLSESAALSQAETKHPATEKASSYLFQ